ncbi:hypothetical protein ACFE04_031677 [Oxalis oulophora]
MAMAKNLLLLTFIVALFGVSFAHHVVYTVGDSAGWKVMGVDYAKWASKHHFHCNGTSPIETYTSGSDKIVLKHAGHQYFICGFPGHCKMGQKVDILVRTKKV